jgi:hypothetical protein
MVAAGTWIKRPRKSHFQRAEIAAAMRTDMKDAPRLRKKIVVEPNWHLRSLSKGAPPVAPLVP